VTSFIQAPAFLFITIMHLTKIKKLISDLRPALEKNNYSIFDTKELDYGMKIKFHKDNEIVIFIIYFSVKKGFSFVFEGNVPQKYKDELISIFTSTAFTENDENNTEFSIYAGMDESGKGDYFGPLVCAGFLISPEIKNDVIKTGVKDCKKLSDNNVLRIYGELKNQFPDRINFISLTPIEYNSMYDNLKKTGKKLNELLGNIYAQLITAFISNKAKFINIDGFFIDHFADMSVIKNELKINEKISIKSAIRAESDTAVAAASVVARAEFLNGIQKLSDKYGIEIPLGAGSNVDTLAKSLYKKIGIQEMHYLVKIHFKNTMRFSS